LRDFTREGVEPNLGWKELEAKAFDNLNGELPEHNLRKQLQLIKERLRRDEYGMLLLSMLDESDFQWNDLNNPNQETMNERVLYEVKIVYQHMKAEGMLLCFLVSRSRLSRLSRLFLL